MMQASEAAVLFEQDVLELGEGVAFGLWDESYEPALYPLLRCLSALSKRMRDEAA